MREKQPDTVTVRLSYKENKFLERILDGLDFTLTDEEEEARARLREKFGPARKQGGWIAFTYEEVHFLAKMARESFSFVSGREKIARKQLGATLARAVLDVRARR